MLFEDLRLNNSNKAKREINDLVYVSHIDQDYIAGVLQLFDDLKNWWTYDYRSKENKKLDKPLSSRAPEVEAVRYNTFHEQVGNNAGRIEDILAVSDDDSFEDK